ncbi:MAG: MATE family efflux transporter [Clostridiales bacterium]|jgi:putative MATE family efflux protein|nr:MATE family efflux transporter [Clostridiales bacterium]
MARFENDLTEGSVTRKLVRFSLPFLMSNLLQSVYGATDLYIVSQFNGPESISGVNLGTQLTFLILNIVFGLMTGGTVLVSQYLGAGRKKDVAEAIGTLFTVMGILAVFFTIVGLAFDDQLLNLINTPPEAFAEAKIYFRVCVWGLIFTFAYNAIAAVLRGMGDSKNPLIFVAIAAGVNIVLDVVFVYNLGMSAAGAAIATVIAQALSVAISIVYLIRSRFMFDFKLRSFKIYKEKLKLQLSLGLPASVQNSITSLSFLTMTALVNSYGVYASTAVGIVAKLNGFAILPSMAMSSAVASMAGQNVGAGHFDRALKTMRVGRYLVLGVGVILFALIQIFPAMFIKIFNSDPQTVEYGVQYIRAFSLDYMIVPFAFCAHGLLSGSGRTLYIAATSIICSLILRIPVAYLLSGPVGLGLAGVALAVPVGSLGNYALNIAYIMTGKWKRSKITGKDAVPN